MIMYLSSGGNPILISNSNPIPFIALLLQDLFFCILRQVIPSGSNVKNTSLKLFPHAVLTLVKIFIIKHSLWKEGNVLFNDALNTFDFTNIWCWTHNKRPLR